MKENELDRSDGHKTYTYSWSEILKSTDHFKDIGIDVIIILNGSCKHGVGSCALNSYSYI
jgi:hypothetical protein